MNHAWIKFQGAFGWPWGLVLTNSGFRASTRNESIMKLNSSNFYWPLWLSFFFCINGWPDLSSLHDLNLARACLLKFPCRELQSLPASPIEISPELHDGIFGHSKFLYDAFNYHLLVFSPISIIMYFNLPSFSEGIIFSPISKFLGHLSPCSAKGSCNSLAQPLLWGLDGLPILSFCGHMLGKDAHTRPFFRKKKILFAVPFPLTCPECLRNFKSFAYVLVCPG